MDTYILGDICTQRDTEGHTGRHIDTEGHTHSYKHIHTDTHT